MPEEETPGHEDREGVATFHGVRYQVKDVARSVAFYVQHLGFTPGLQQLPAFASVSLDPLTILLSGPGGKQVQLEDPDGNPIELFEPAR